MARQFIAENVVLAGLGGVLAIGLGEDPFGVMRLACWGLFVHGPAWAFLAGATLLPRSRAWGLGGIVVGVVLVAVGVDAFFIEPTRLEVTHVEVASDKLTQPITVAVIADFQTDSIGEYERLEGAGIQDTETQDGRSSAGSDIPEFSAFVLDFFMAGVGAVVALRLTNFLGVREIGAGTVVPILFAVVLLTIVFCCMFLWLFRARSLRQKFLGYAAIAAMVLLDACGDG